MNRFTLLPSLALSLLTPFTAAQSGDEPFGPPLLSLSEITLEQYRVQHVNAAELYQLAKQLVGRTYFIKENGGPRSDLVSNLRVLSDTIVLYDTKQTVQRARELLVRLDVAREGAEEDWKALEYKPRFVSMRAVVDAVENLIDVDVVPERGLIVLQGRPERVASVLELLERIDVPARQVLLTCQLIEVDGSARGPALPKDLLENLRKLLPESQFSQAGMAMLQSSVGGTDPISVQIESTGKRYQFSFLPVAFDESSGSLTIGSCALVEESEHGPRQLFSTNTVLRGGEYTVLAATGATPRLLVVRVAPQP